MPREAIKKLYYSIGEVSVATDLKQYVLRYWESEFPQLSPAKNRAGNRTYREKDIELVNFIKTLLYEKKYTIEGARQKLKELQDNGLALNILSLEDHVPTPQPSVKIQPPEVQVPVSAPVSVAPSNIDPEHYRKFLTKLRTDLKHLLELIDA